MTEGDVNNLNDVKDDKYAFIKDITDEFFPGYFNNERYLKLRVAMFADDVQSVGSQNSFDEIIQDGKKTEKYAKDAKGLEMKGYDFPTDAEKFDSINQMLSNILKGRALQMAQENSKPTERSVETAYPGVNIVRNALTNSEQREMFELVKMPIETQGAKTNISPAANIMIGMGLRWDYIKDNPLKTCSNSKRY